MLNYQLSTLFLISTIMLSCYHGREKTQHYEFEYLDKVSIEGKNIAYNTIYTFRFHNLYEDTIKLSTRNGYLTYEQVRFKMCSSGESGVSFADFAPVESVAIPPRSSKEVKLKYKDICHVEFGITPMSNNFKIFLQVDSTDFDAAH